MGASWLPRTFHRHSNIFCVVCMYVRSIHPHWYGCHAGIKIDARNRHALLPFLVATYIKKNTRNTALVSFGELNRRSFSLCWFEVGLVTASLNALQKKKRGLDLLSIQVKYHTCEHLEHFEYLFTQQNWNRNILFIYREAKSCRVSVMCDLLSFGGGG